MSCFGTRAADAVRVERGAAARLLRPPRRRASDKEATRGGGGSGGSAHVEGPAPTAAGPTPHDAGCACAGVDTHVVNPSHAESMDK